MDGPLWNKQWRQCFTALANYSFSKEWPDKKIAALKESL